MFAVNSQTTVAPLLCNGISLLDIAYSEVKVLINSNKAKIFPSSSQHADNADSKSPGAAIWYNGEKGNCLAGFLKFSGNMAEIQLRGTQEFHVDDASVINWCRRLFANPILQKYQIKKITVQGRELRF